MMKWTAICAVLLASIAFSAASEDIPSYLRQAKEPEQRRTSIFSIFSDAYRGYNTHYRGGDRIRDGGSSHCSKDRKCDECEGDCDHVSAD